MISTYKDLGMDVVERSKVYNTSFWYRYSEIYRSIRINYRQTSDCYARLARVFTYGAELIQGEVIDEDLK